MVNIIEQEHFRVSPMMEFVRGKSWTRQPLNDAWDAPNWDGLCGTPWQTVVPELKWTKKVASDNGEPDPNKGCS